MASGSNERQGYVWKASGLVAVMDITGRLCHKGTVLYQGRKSACMHWCLWRCGRTCRGGLSVCEDLQDEWNLHCGIGRLMRLLIDKTATGSTVVSTIVSFHCTWF